MSIQNQIFQVQNAIFQVLTDGEIGVEIIANRGFLVNNPYVIILGTKKQVLSNLQIRTQTEINIVTKDFSIITASMILEQIEKCMIQERVQEKVQFFDVNHVNLINAEVAPNSEGFFIGKAFVEIVLM